MAEVKKAQNSYFKLALIDFKGDVKRVFEKTKISGEFRDGILGRVSPKGKYFIFKGFKSGISILELDSGDCVNVLKDKNI